MEKLLIVSQIIVATSIIIIWVFIKKNIIIEFEEYNISDIIRDIVGTIKIYLVTILILGICYK